MTETTRTDIIRAYEALDDICNLVIMGRGYPANEYRNLILAALPPRPRPTMAEVEWDDDKHHFAEAEHPIYGKVIMLFQSPNTGNIYFTYLGSGEQNYVYSLPECLTLTGKRYTLTEVQE